jgi:ubiquinone/menaquinone biosynthesis C-methylase UbiE
VSQIFKQCVRHLLQGKALSAEDVVDILTLKDNLDNTDDYATALHILARVRVSRGVFVMLDPCRTRVLLEHA